MGLWCSLIGQALVNQVELFSARLQSYVYIGESSANLRIQHGARTARTCHLGLTYVLEDYATEEQS